MSIHRDLNKSALCSSCIPFIERFFFEIKLGTGFTIRSCATDEATAKEDCKNHQTKPKTCETCHDKDLCNSAGYFTPKNSLFILPMAIITNLLL